MNYLELNNLKIQNVNINTCLEYHKVYGVLASNYSIIEEFLLKLAGINKNNNSIRFNNTDIFDNQDYFKNRIYLDFTMKYIKTLNAEYVCENVENRFEKVFDKNNFRSLVKKYTIRRYATIDGIYKFNDFGNTLVNYAFLNSLDVNNIIINYPTFELNKLEEEKIKLILHDICDTNRYNSVIIGLDTVKYCKDLIDEVIIIPDSIYNSSSYKVDPNNVSFLVVEDNINLHDKLFKAKDFSNIIVLNNYSKEELKYFDKVRIKYKRIDFYSLMEHMI